MEDTAFSNRSTCVWVGYPPGAAGDLLGTIINFHYGFTGCTFNGINSAGKVDFSSADAKFINLSIMANDDTLQINEELFRGINLGLLDFPRAETLFTTHAWRANNINKILASFPYAKMIRLIPGDHNEASIVTWLHNYKNHGIKEPLNHILLSQHDTRQMKPPHLLEFPKPHHRLLEITFSELINPAKFELLYNKLIAFLYWDTKIVRYDFIQHWIDKQDSYIRPFINDLK